MNFYLLIKIIREVQIILYAYVLTPLGIDIKKELITTFLEPKLTEYITLQQKIKELEEGLVQ